MKRFLATFVAILTLALPAAAQDVTRKITKVAGDVYLFQNNRHMSLIVVTSEGTVRVDPINTEAGAWLNENLSSVTDKPVTHLIYSHSHLDHASGGSAHPGAVIVAHENAPAQIDGVAPTIRVGDSHEMTVGNKTIETHFLGGGHGEDMIAVVVRPENVGFIVDVAAPKRLPFRNFGGSNVDDWINQIKAAQALDFEIFAPGHGNVGVHGDLADAITYLVDLKANVTEGLNAGKSVADLQQELTLDAYKDWLNYADWRAENIEGMATFLQTSGQLN